MAYNTLPNFAKLQKANSNKINIAIGKGTTDSAVGRGEDLDSDSVIEDILYLWAKDVIVNIKKSVIDHGFNEKGNLANKAVPHVIDKAGSLNVLQIDLSEEWFWAERGRAKGKRPPVSAIENWITFRGIDVNKVKEWTRSTDEGKLIKPYKNLSNTLELRHIMAEAIVHSIGKRGTIKGDGRGGSQKWGGYKGSGFLTKALPDSVLQELSNQVGRALGYKVAISLSSSFSDHAEELATQVWKKANTK